MSGRGARNGQVAVHPGQGDLFERPQAPYRRHGTSEDAAWEIDEHLSRLEAEVLRYLYLSGAHTCDEVEVGIDMRHQTASARLNGLERKQLVFDSGMRRATRSGRQAMVYALTTAGRAVAKEAERSADGARARPAGARMNDLQPRGV